MDAAKETTILLVRHGETVDNARQIMQGQTQGELNERGSWQRIPLMSSLPATCGEPYRRQRLSLPPTVYPW